MAFSALFFPDQRSSILNFVNRRRNNANAIAQTPSNAKFIPFYTMPMSKQTRFLLISLRFIYLPPSLFFLYLTTLAFKTIFGNRYFLLYEILALGCYLHDFYTWKIYLISHHSGYSILSALQTNYFVWDKLEDWSKNYVYILVPIENTLTIFSTRS